MRLRVDRIFLFAAAAALLAGCSGYRASYDIGLVKAVRPAAAESKYGQQDISRVKENGPDQSFFEDGLVKIVWTPTADEVAFELTNKTSQPLVIRWEDAKFIDSDGTEKRLVHSGVDYAKKNDPQEATVVEGGATLRDAVCPADNIYYSDLRWQRKPLFPTFAMSRKVENFEEEVQAYIGKSFRILLPLEIDGTVQVYSFSFEVMDVVVGE